MDRHRRGGTEPEAWDSRPGPWFCPRTLRASGGERRPWRSPALLLQNLSQSQQVADDPAPGGLEAGEDAVAARPSHLLPKWARGNTDVVSCREDRAVSQCSTNVQTVSCLWKE